jgi:hypothetical protein
MNLDINIKRAQNGYLVTIACNKLYVFPNLTDAVDFIDRYMTETFVADIKANNSSTFVPEEKR